MTNNHFIYYVQKKWKKFRDTVTNISKDESGKAFVSSRVQVYSFDKKIVPNLFKRKDIFPCSADGIVIVKKNINVIEFKTGFKQKTTTESFDVKRGACPKLKPPVPCPEYWDQFFKRQKKEREELKKSLMIKAIETYITLEKHYFSKYLLEDKVKINYIAVIDGDYIDAEEKLLGTIAGRKTTKTRNTFEEVKNSLNRLKKHHFKNYYYDNIEVLSDVEFYERIKNW